MAVCQMKHFSLIHRHRGQVESSHRPSHIWISIDNKFLVINK
jgi:hypothetical protein